MINKLLLIGIFFFQFSMLSQVNYSEKALTGRGELELVGENYKLQKEVFEAYKEMQKAALKDGINIQIVSAYRSFEKQKLIWNRKYFKYVKQGLEPEEVLLKIIEYSTIPGTSRHHWGTDIDIIEGGKKYSKGVLVENNYEGAGIYSELKKWMDINAEKFGFYLVYTNKINRKGFKYEPWHYSYKSISKPMLKLFLEVDLSIILSENQLKGNEHLTSKFLKKYIKEQVLGINLKLNK